MRRFASTVLAIALLGAACGTETAPNAEIASTTPPTDSDLFVDEDTTDDAARSGADDTAAEDLDADDLDADDLDADRSLAVYFDDEWRTHPSAALIPEATLFGDGWTLRRVEVEPGPDVDPQRERNVGDDNCPVMSPAIEREPDALQALFEDGDSELRLEVRVSDEFTATEMIRSIDEYLRCEPDPSAVQVTSDADWTHATSQQVEMGLNSGAQHEYTVTFVTSRHGGTITTAVVFSLDETITPQVVAGWVDQIAAGR